MRYIFYLENNKISQRWHLHLRKFFEECLNNEWNWQDHEKLKPSQHLLAGATSNKTVCVMMLLINLRHPEWLGADCHKPIFSKTVCALQPTDKGNSTSDPLGSWNVDSACPFGFLRKNTKCYMFLWNSGNETIGDKCAFVLARIQNSSSFSEIEHITTSYKISPLMLKCNALVHLFVFNVTLDKYQKIPAKFPQGFQLCSKSAAVNIIGSNVCKSVSGSYTSALLSHCKTDQTFANKNDIISTAEDSEDLHNNSLNMSCPSLHFLQSNKMCSKYAQLPSEHSSAVQSQNKSVDAHLFLCEDGSQLDLVMVDDLLSDCTLAEDERVFIALLTFNIKHYCKNKNEIPCYPGHHKCFNISELCVFRINNFKHIVPCRNGVHLQQCKTFECDKTYKCPRYYCIPWELVCNGHFDCPGGADEEQWVCLQTQQCKGMYKCHGLKHICLHMGTVCDKVNNCPEEDDENLCELNTIHCPANCNCLVFAMECTNTTVKFVTANYPYIFVKLENVVASNTDDVWKFKLAVHLEFINVQLTELCALIVGHHLSQFTTTQNRFETLERHCFRKTPSLLHLNIKDNKIHTLGKKSLLDLILLKHLDLSENRLETLPANAFPCTLHSLILSHNPFTSFNFFFFIHMYVTHVQTDDFKICCIAPPETKCCSKQPWYLSCDQLLPSLAQKVTFRVISSLIGFLNICSVTLHLNSRKRNLQNVLMILSIAFYDMLQGICLHMIYIPDKVFGETFQLVQHKWRSSFTCYSVSATSFTFHTSEPITVGLLFLLRLMIVKYPIDTRFKRTSFCLNCVAATHGFGFVSLLVSVLVFALSVIQMPSTICSPFVDPTHSFLVFKIFTFVVTLLQVSSFSVVITSFCIMLQELKKSQQLRKSGSTESYKGLKIQSVIMIISYSLCWWPTNILNIVYSFLLKYSVIVVPWVVVSVMSINSIINPLVLVINMSKTLYKEHKAGKSKPKQEAIDHNVLTALPH